MFGICFPVIPILTFTLLTRFFQPFILSRFSTIRVIFSWRYTVSTRIEHFSLVPSYKFYRLIHLLPRYMPGYT